MRTILGQVRTGASGERAQAVNRVDDDQVVGIYPATALRYWEFANAKGYKSSRNATQKAKAREKRLALVAELQAKTEEWLELDGPAVKTCMTTPMRWTRSWLRGLRARQPYAKPTGRRQRWRHKRVERDGFIFRRSRSLTPSPRDAWRSSDPSVSRPSPGTLASTRVGYPVRSPSPHSLTARLVSIRERGWTTRAILRLVVDVVGAGPPLAAR